MPDFLPMLRARNAFSNRNFGMPSIDNTSGSEILSQAASAANNMKLQDMNRAKEMMLFQTRLQAQQEARQQMNQQLEQNRRTVFGPANKQKVVQIAPLTSMQRQFKQEADEARENKFRMGQLAAQESGRLNTALATGKQREEGDTARLTASLNAQREEGAASRTSAEKIAASKAQAEIDQREDTQKFTAGENDKNRNQKGTPYMMADPNDPDKQISVRFNPATNRVERVKLEGQDVGELTKPGTPSKTKATSAQESGMSMAQEALDEITNNLLDDKDQLSEKAKWATGATSILGKIPLPTQARAGRASIKKVAAQQLLSLIGHLKSQSRTGATGMGNMSNQDRQALEAAASKLGEENLSLPEEDIRKEIVRVRDILRRTVARDDESDVKTEGTKLTYEELKKKYGGE